MIAFFQALIAFFLYDALAFFCRFHTMHWVVRTWPVACKSTDGNVVDNICTAVNHAAAWYPKQILCLQRAFVTTCLLRRVGISARMVLGAQKLPFKAHAWVEVDGHPINERSNVEVTYAVWDRC